MSMDTDCICSETKSFHQVIACLFSWLLLPILVPVCLNACRRLVDSSGCGRKDTRCRDCKKLHHLFVVSPTLQPGDLSCLLPLLYSGKEPSLEKTEDAESEIMMNRYWRERTYFATTKYIWGYIKNPRIRSNHWLDEPLTI